MQELLLAINKSKSRPSGPGPQDIISGDENYGYYGIAPGSEMPTTTQLMAAIGTPITSEMILSHDVCDYFKFAHEGKVKFIPFYPLIQGFSWLKIYRAGAVYGTPTTQGRYPPSGESRLQDANINFGGNSFMIKLMSAGVDPFVYTGQVAVDSDYYMLLYRVTSGWSGSDRWGSYTPVELQGTSYMWIQQSRSGFTESKLSIQGLARAVQGYSNTADDSRTILEWRPILQLES